jgi:integrase
VSQQLYRRCGCRDENGRQYGKHCPKLENPKHGTWGYYLSHGSDPKTKQRRQYRKAGFKTRAAAASAVAKLKTSLDTGTYVEPRKITLAEYAPEILSRRETTGNGLKPTTMATYERYVRQDIVPSRLGEMRLTDIRRSHVNDWVSDLTKAGRGAVTVHRALATLQMIITQAVRDEILSFNPARMIDKPKLSGDSSVKFWEAEQVGEFFARCGRHRLGSLFELAAYTGLRRGELAGLHWSDVDLVGRQIDVRHNRVSVDGRVQETTTKPVQDAVWCLSAMLQWQPCFLEADTGR